jgi:very-short-patch-repair endonuclease
MLERAQQLRITSNAAERRMWSIVRSRRLTGLKFRRQHLIGDYVADFVCLAARLVIEVDGDTHGSDEAEAKDTRRTEAIERAGFRVIRFWNDYVLHNADGGLEDMILEALMASALPASEKARLEAQGYVATRSLLKPLSPTLSREGEGDAASSPSPRPSPLKGKGRCCFKPLTPTLSPEGRGSS